MERREGLVPVADVGAPVDIREKGELGQEMRYEKSHSADEREVQVGKKAVEDVALDQAIIF